MLLQFVQSISVEVCPSVTSLLNMAPSLLRTFNKPMPILGRLIAALLLLVLAIPKRAVASTFSATQFLASYKKSNAAEKQLLEIAVNNLHGGLFWANVALRRKGQAPLYCQPERLSLTSVQLINMIENEMRDDADLKDAPFGVVLLIALQKVFPCP